VLRTGGKTMPDLFERLPVLTANLTSRRGFLRGAGVAGGTAVSLLSGILRVPTAEAANCVSCGGTDFCSCGTGGCTGGLGCYCCAEWYVGQCSWNYYCGGWPSNYVQTWVHCITAFSCCQCQDQYFGPFWQCSCPGWCYPPCQQPNPCFCNPYPCSC